MSYIHQLKVDGQSEMNADVEECKVLRCSVSIEETEVEDRELWFFDIFYWVCTTSTVVLGIPLACLIVHYEWYGGDSQKRSLVNRFMSNGVVTNIISSISILLLPGFLRFFGLIIRGCNSDPRYLNWLCPSGTKWALPMSQLSCSKCT